MWAEKRAASPPECGSHSQMTAGVPIQNGCSDSWRAWRSTHGTLARQLSCAQLFTLGVTRLLATAPPPPGDLMYQFQLLAFSHWARSVMP